MARLQDRDKVLRLRKEKQMSYSQIKKLLGISKSTLSYWLRDYPLSERRIKELQRMGARQSEQAIEKYRTTMRRKKEKRLAETYKTQKKLILPLSKREFFVAGLLLYWGEGAKSQQYGLNVTNSDPSVIKFFICWLTKILSVSKSEIRIQLHLYSDMNINREIKYWSETLKIPAKQFARPYIKKTSSKRINHKGGFGHGTCNARVGGARLAEKVRMAIKAIADKYSKMRT